MYFPTSAVGYGIILRLIVVILVLLLDAFAVRGPDADGVARAGRPRVGGGAFGELPVFRRWCAML